MNQSGCKLQSMAYYSSRLSKNTHTMINRYMTVMDLHWLEIYSSGRHRPTKTLEVSLNTEATHPGCFAPIPRKTFVHNILFIFKTLFQHLDTQKVSERLNCESLCMLWFVCFVSLRPSQQLWSRGDCQFTYSLNKRLTK